MMGITMKSVIRIAELLVPLLGLQLTIASPVGGQDCDMVVTEMVTLHLATQVLFPASTITSKVFRPGQPVTTTAEDLNETASSTASISYPVTTLSSSVETSGIPCEGASTSTITLHNVETIHVVQEPATVEVVVHPCATPLPTLIPTMPYGTYSDVLGSPGTQTGNDRYDLDTPRGASAEACCNACFFELSYCIAAYWYFYEGCVYNQGVVSNGVIGNGVPLTGNGKSVACPQGKVQGLVYTNDTSSPAFRSTGDFAGPCGETYEN